MVDCSNVYLSIDGEILEDHVDAPRLGEYGAVDNCERYREQVGRRLKVRILIMITYSVVIVTFCMNIRSWWN